jgi:hypothetical protein
MPGCCLGALVLFFGPRAVLLFAWLVTNWYSAFESRLVALLGFFFVPWTSLAWMYVFFHHHGDVGGGYALLLAVGAVTDLSTYGGSHAARPRRRDDWEPQRQGCNTQRSGRRAPPELPATQ